MTFEQFKQQVARTLGNYPAGLTRQELRQKAQLPYDRPCPEWTKRLEKELGLNRTDKQGNSLVWKI